MVIDTDVLVWYMKGNEKAYKAIENSKNFFISVITYMELFQGMRNKNELNHLRKALHAWNSKILYISEEISCQSNVLCRTTLFKPFHSTCGRTDRGNGHFLRYADFNWE